MSSDIVNMPEDLLALVAEDPFRAFVGVTHTVQVAKNVVVVPGLLAMGVGDVGQADVLVPSRRIS